MAQITLNSSGVASNGSLVLQSNGTTTAATFDTSQKLTLPNDAVVNGLTVGRGAGAVSTNTAVGASALQANTTGSTNTAVGYQASYSATTNASDTTLGWQAGYTKNTASDTLASTFVGARAGYATSTGVDNTFIGGYAGRNNSTGSNNAGIGTGALFSNTTASNNTAVGYQSLYSNTTGTGNTALGYSAMSFNTTGNYNIAIGGVGSSGGTALNVNTTGAQNVAVGNGSLQANTTASNNTAVGYQALYTGSTFAGVGAVTAIGHSAGYTNNSYSGVFVGQNAGLNSTGYGNTMVGQGAGNAVTTGAANTILGRYSGNQGGLDIRTASNYIVLSDGDGNPQIYNDGTYTVFGLGGTSASYTGSLYLNGADANSRAAYINFRSNGSAVGYVGLYRGIVSGNAGSNNFIMCMNTSGGVYLNGASATSWTAVSDETRKVIIEPITDAANKVSTLRTVIGRLKTDEEDVRRPYLIAQDVQAVLPEAVTEAEDKEGPVLGLSYTEVIPLLVAAIKELKAEIDQLKGQA